MFGKDASAHPPFGSGETIRRHPPFDCFAAAYVSDFLMFLTGAEEKTEISSVAHFRLAANSGDRRQGVVNSEAPRGSIR